MEKMPDHAITCTDSACLGGLRCMGDVERQEVERLRTALTSLLAACEPVEEWAAADGSATPHTIRRIALAAAEARKALEVPRG